MLVRQGEFHRAVGLVGILGEELRLEALQVVAEPGLRCRRSHVLRRLLLYRGSIPADFSVGALGIPFVNNSSAASPQQPDCAASICSSTDLPSQLRTGRANCGTPGAQYRSRPVS
jgi:hypothetical protein